MLESAEIIIKPSPSNDPKKRQPNIDLAKKILNGWESKIELVEGLTKTIEYFKNIYLIKIPYIC